MRVTRLGESPNCGVDRESLNSVLAILVCYKQRIEAIETLTSLRRGLNEMSAQIDIVIYDNSPSPMLASDAVLPAEFRPRYIHDRSNPGVSKAYNQGAAVARNEGKKWLLLLDQDTTFPPEAIQQYLAGMREDSEAVMFAPILRAGAKYISPCKFSLGRGHSLSAVSPGALPFKKRSVLNSGMMVQLKAFDAVGGFNENIPLDFSDHDFCRRFGRLFRGVHILNITSLHGFSDAGRVETPSALARFAFFCRGARHSILTYGDIFSYSYAAFVRCIELSLKYRTLKFVPIYLCVYLLGATG
jgi:glycosyltransferase involved in cell wall biosynthesis